MTNELSIRASLSMDYCSAQRELRAYHHRMIEARKRGDTAEATACERMWNESIGKRDYIPEIASKIGIYGIRFQELCDEVNEQCDAEYGFDY